MRSKHGKEGRTFEIGVKELLLLLNEVSAASAMAEDTQATQAKELLVTDHRTVQMSTGVVLVNVH